MTPSTVMRTRHRIGIACFILLAPIATETYAQRLTPVELYEARNRTIELFQQGKMDSALVLLRRVAPLDSADAYLWRRYGRAARTQKQWDEAARALEYSYRLGLFNRATAALEIANTYMAAG